MEFLKRINMLFLFCAVLASFCIAGCKCKHEEVDDTKEDSVEAELLTNLEPLKVTLADGSQKTITFKQAMEMHEEHESHGVHDEDHRHHQESEICLGTLVGYRALQFAVNQLYDNEIPQEKDIQMGVEFPLDSAIDLFEFYSGNTCELAMEPLDYSPAMFTFTAKRVSNGSSLKFRINDNLIPDEFFALKKQGKTCSDMRIQGAKETGIHKILTTELASCFMQLD